MEVCSQLCNTPITCGRWFVVCTVLLKWLGASRVRAMRDRLRRRVGLVLTMALLTMPGLWSKSTASKQQEIQFHMRRAQQALGTSDFAAAEQEFRAVVTLDP